MDEQDGISVRPMRLKVLYTFDDKTNCLARWPHVLDIQAAYLDDETQIGVIELKTCIQAIVSASPELVANLGRDYTVYAYDYSEYETPLVGQGMLSWVLASASPTPNAPAHQSKTIVTGRVCKNALGLLTRNAHETLEVKLRLVPVPTALQSEYLESMNKYRELSDVIPHDFDAQAWTSFLQANPGLLGNSNTNNNNSQQSTEQEASQVDRSGIEKLQQLLSEGSTPRDFSNPAPPESVRADSPAPSMSRAPSRNSTPGTARPAYQQQKRGSEEAFRPASQGSTQSLGQDTGRHGGRPSTGRRDSVMSGYASGDERPDGPAQKRARLVQPDSTEKPNTNIERQSGSLRVAASTAASVRIHRPTPLNPGEPPQLAGEEPVRPPTPMPSGMSAPAPARRSRAPASSLRRQSTTNSQFSNFSEDIATDDNQTAVTSPEDVRGGNAADTPFNMPSSPPTMHNPYPPQTSSPVLPPMPDHDSGFMSGHLDSMLDDENCNPDGKEGTTETQRMPSIAPKPSGISTSREHSSNHRNHSQQVMSENTVDCALRDAAPGLPPQPASSNGSRSSSRASFRRPSKPLAPSRVSQSEAGGGVDQGRGQVHSSASVVPASDPVQQLNDSRSQSQSMDAPASELTSSTPAPTRLDDSKARSGGAAYGGRKQVQARLDQCIKDGTVPPYCENCGAIETTTWRRAWSKVLEGDADAANSHLNDHGALFWEVVDSDENGVVTSFRLLKKSVLPDDKDYNMQLLCNPCGLWLNKTKTMRPENKWNKAPPKDKRKRKSKRMRILEAPGAATRSTARRLAMKGAESSPGPAEASSPQAEDEESPEAETGLEETGSDETVNNQETNETVDQRARRANSVELPHSGQNATQWSDADAVDALKRAIQSSPARNFDTRHTQLSETQLTPKPVRRSLFSSASKSKDEEAMRTLSDAFINGMSRTPRSTPKKQHNEKENGKPAAPRNGPDGSLDACDGENEAMDFPSSPTPKRRSPRRLVSANKSNTDKGTSVSSPSPSTEQQMQPPQLPRQGSSGLSDSASRVNSNAKTSQPTSVSPQKNPNSQHIETLDGLIFNIFDSEDERGVQQSPNLFTPSKWPSVDGWADWLPSGHISPTGTTSAQTRPDSGVSGKSNEEFTKMLTSPSFLQRDIDDESIRQLFGGAPSDKSQDASETLDSDMFNPGLVDPHLLEMWSKGADGEAGANGIGELDDTALAAMMQEVNGDPNS